jgi:hypothetical protein
MDRHAHTTAERPRQSGAGPDGMKDGRNTDMNDILIALEIYFIGFVIAVIMAALIKGLVLVISRRPPEEGGAKKNEEGTA